MMSLNNKKKLREHLPSLSILTVEFISIVVGVLFALSVNQWNESRKNRILAEEALAHVVEELKINQRLIESVHDRNLVMMASLSAEDSQEGQERVQFVPGLQVNDHAWNALLTSGISTGIDYQRLLQISEIYSYQTVYKQFSSQVVESIMNASVMTAAMGNELDEDRFSRQLLPSFTVILTLEEHLLGLYQEVLQALQNPATGNG